MPAPDVPEPRSRVSGVPRDREAEIDAAVAVLAGSPAPVSAGTGTAARRIRFLHCDDVVDEAGDGWSPFHGRVGELAVRGSELQVGLGARAEHVDRGSALESARSTASMAANRLPDGDVALEVPNDVAGLVAAVVDGLADGHAGTGSTRLLVDPSVLAEARRGLLIAAAVRLGRRLTSAPANLLTPERAAGWATEIARRSGLRCSVLGPDEISEQGFGALAAIGAGSVNGPRLVRLDYVADPSAPRLALVGKGITFDTGGLSLKSPAAMQSMRLDVAGAATVLSVMAALRSAGCAVNVTAVLPFAENMPGPRAHRPGDVVTAWSGTQIQLLDLDFEGRVVLADALALAASTKPDLLVDLATLTYQAEIALGPEIAAVLGRDDDAVDAVLAAAADAGEPMWRLPLATRYVDQVRTPFGVRNHPLHDTGRAITAALFLAEFVPVDVPWVHCDMTGPAWRGNASVDGATGFGARTLLHLVERMTA